MRRTNTGLVVSSTGQSVMSTPGVFNANASPYSAVANNSLYDNAPGITAAIADAVTYAAANNGIGIVEFDSGEYWISGALQTTGTCYAQIPLPLIAPAAVKLLLVLRAKVGSYTAYSSIYQSAIQPAGPVIFHSTLTGQTYSGTYGTPSILGGPDPKQVAPLYFSNIKVHTQGISFREVTNPSVCAINFSCVNAAIVEDARFDTEATSIAAIVQPTHPTGIACLMPGYANNDDTAYRGTVVAVGYYSGPGIVEHLQAEKLVAWFCYVGLNIQGNYGHVAHIDHASVEDCPYAIATVNPSSGIVSPSGGTNTSPFVIDVLDIEDMASGWAMPVYHINDPTNQYRGRVGFWLLSAASVALINGAALLGIDYIFTPASINPWMVDVDVFQAVASLHWSSILSTGGFIYGGFVENIGSGTDSYRQWNITLSPGTWDIGVMCTTGPNYGIITASVNGIAVGTIDCYSASPTFNVLSAITGIVVPGVGSPTGLGSALGQTYTLRFAMATKNGTSTAYYCDLQHIQLRRTA